MSEASEGNKVIELNTKVSRREFLARGVLSSLGVAGGALIIPPFSEYSRSILKRIYTAIMPKRPEEDIQQMKQKHPPAPVKKV